MIHLTIGKKEYFKNIEQIKFEGSDSKNPLAFKWYDKKRIIAGKTMGEYLKFACAYWHTFCGNGADPFGEPTLLREWNTHKDPIQRAKDKMDAAFEFITKMNLGYYCFHDFDFVDLTDDVVENEERLKTMVEYAKEKQKLSGVKLLWGTCNTHTNKKYMSGSATNPDFKILAHSAAQEKAALEATIELGGQNYVFWGGREGYLSLLNTNTQLEKENYAQYLTLARDFARKKEFKGNFFVEPKPCEPTKHQYDFDTETAIGFLREYNLLHDFKINIEVNHATLAGHTFQHELQMAANHNMLGSIDINRGDAQNGWDTDQFPNNLNDCIESMLVILESGGFQGGGINFDAKLRRNSTDLEDMFLAHIGGMDTMARALIIAEDILNNTDFKKRRDDLYASFFEGKGKEFREGKLTLEDLRDYATSIKEINLQSGKQEYFEYLINNSIK